MPRQTMNSQSSMLPIANQLNSPQAPNPTSNPNQPANSSSNPNQQSNSSSNPIQQSTSSANSSTSNQNARPNMSSNNTNFSNLQNGTTHTAVNITLTERQFSNLLGNLSSTQERKITFSSCSARFNGGRNTSKVEDFIATILVFKEAENISNEMALISLPLLLEGYASTWWQGLKYEAKTFEEAIELLRSAFAPPKPDWRIFSEIFQDKQKPFESTDSFVCRKRCLFAQLKERLSESTIINMVFSQISIPIREKINRETVETFHDLLSKARDIELCINENNSENSKKPFESREKTQSRCSYCRKKNHTADVCYKRIEVEKKGKPEESKINCYGCGAVGYYRSNCPTCNYKTVLESPKLLDFNSIQTTTVGRNVPTVHINVCGLNGVAYLDTAARTSIAGYYLFKS